MGEGSNEFLEKLNANHTTLNSLLRSKNTNCVSLYLSLSNCVINIKKFLDRVLKEESVLKVKCKHVEERDRVSKFSNNSDENKENIGDTDRQARPLPNIKSPHVQQDRVFERKSVNKQFDRAEKVIDKPSKIEEDKTEKMGEP